jgi:hypothetical protein
VNLVGIGRLPSEQATRALAMFVFQGGTERTPSGGPASSNGHPVVAAMIAGGLEGCGPSQPLPAANLTPFHGADGAGALQGIGQQWPSVVAAMIAGGMMRGSLRADLRAARQSTPPKSFVSLRLKMRKQDHISNRFGSRQYHHEAVYTDPYPTGGRHPMFQSQ